MTKRGEKMRQTHIVGNWKMNQNLKDIDSFIEQLKTIEAPSVNAWIAPQFVHIPYLLEKKEQLPWLQIGAQNCSHATQGAFTGDVSASALKELGTHFTIIGHSERRSIFQESNELQNAKVKEALKNKLIAIFCVGETLEDREADKTFSVITEQLLSGLKDLSPEEKRDIIIAYEPVWAIGTGKTATPQQAEEVHLFIRNLLKDELGFSSEETIILYGGSVKPTNIQELLACPNIDGGLVGGASLKAEDFIKLCTTI